MILRQESSLRFRCFFFFRIHEPNVRVSNYSSHLYTITPQHHDTREHINANNEITLISIVSAISSRRPSVQMWAKVSSLLPLMESHVTYIGKL